VGRTYNFLSSNPSIKFLVRKFPRTYNEFYLTTFKKTHKFTEDKFREVLKKAYYGGLDCTISTVVTTTTTTTTTTECSRYCDYHPPSYCEVARVKSRFRSASPTQVFRICSTLTNRICPQIWIKLGNFIFHKDSFSDSNYYAKNRRLTQPYLCHLLLRKAQQISTNEAQNNQISLFSKKPRMAPEPTRASIQWVPGSIPRRDVDHSPPSTAEVKNEWSCNLYSPYTSAWCPYRHLYLYL
jgi:hypothetical protein